MRNDAIVDAYGSGGYTLSDIARSVGRAKRNPPNTVAVTEGL